MPPTCLYLLFLLALDLSLPGLFFFFLFMVLDCIGKTGVNCFLFFFHYFSTNLKLFFPLLTY